MSTDTAAAAAPEEHGAGEPPVLIVGAGPVGLVVACELLRRAVPVRVVDKHRSTTDASKAIIVWPRTLELLEGTGVAREMAAAGHPLDGVRFCSSGKQIGAVDVTALRDSPFNHILMLPQWETERILLARFTALGGSIEWGTEVLEVRSGPEAATAVLRHADGQVETARAPWLVGADGAHSTVRKQLGIAFDVTSPQATFAIADAPVEGPVDERRLHYFYSPRGAMGVGPLGGGVFRFAVSVRDGQQPDKELFQRALDERAGPLGRVGDPKWSATFQVRCATAACFRSGRAFLVGDAAHVLSPAGGQGLNTGIQDAVNLGWKLAAVQRGSLGAKVLDSYDRERREAVERVSGTTDRQTRWGLLQQPAKVALRDLLVRAAARTGILQRALAPLFSQTDLFYGETSASWPVRAWRYPEVRPGARLPHLAHLAGGGDGPGDPALPLLVLSPGGAAGRTWTGVRAALLAALPAGLRILELDGRDEAHRALAGLLGSAPTALLVRPDGHLLARAEATRPAALSAALAELGATTAEEERHAVHS
ncbi:monooxygenase, FAD-binding [Streptomyces albus]|uniref:Monooxygenase, FAD-binding n=1 Tax=Streptomyces albus (strain ATCC 21838 / DSM 41398 / FERM P-419 / JCM 4703 / NBRC 107858) TaxID=1081613 RepID=A0A0B5F424_STRA4|nr:monooxygenase, FAD-binding [Streptomyces albus]AOU79364.1 monooxygenase, FAD-binding [Streptomyces albus]AYN35090.1 3-(3-hydroxy-phenyl)propionate hydroxylase [Streptomyces albus]